jgi:hypothetical protein
MSLENISYTFNIVYHLFFIKIVFFEYKNKLAIIDLLQINIVNKEYIT